MTYMYSSFEYFNINKITLIFGKKEEEKAHLHMKKKT